MIFLVIITVLAVIITIGSITHVHKINISVDKTNKELEDKQNSYLKSIDELSEKIILKNKIIDDFDGRIKNLQNTEHETQNRIKELTETANAVFDKQKELSQKAFQEYCDNLDKEYQEKDKEYEKLCAGMADAYATEQERMLAESAEIRTELEKIRATKVAAIQAQLKEKEIKDNLSAYCLLLSDKDLQDVKQLKKVEDNLNNPRILRMLVWQTYFQKPLKKLAAEILGPETACGIYKVTNVTNDIAYVGQARDIAKRWSEHAKCGLGIDAPAGNKLYKAMQEDGLWNFSWELLEKCTPEELDEKEKYYIGVYGGVEYSYNSTRGNG